MYGTKARIGLMIPSLNTIVEPEFNAMKPEGVSIHIARLFWVAGAPIAHLKSRDEDIEGPANLLAAAWANIIVYGCTIGSLAKGIGWDQEIMSRIKRATGVLPTTTSSAVVKAFKELGVKKVAVASPYRAELNKLVTEFVEAHGIKVVNMKGLSMHGQDTLLASPETTYNLVHEVNTPEAEAVFISCANFKSITVIDKLEKELQKYVFSSNTATMWDALRMLNIDDQIKGYGRLFEH